LWFPAGFVVWHRYFYFDKAGISAAERTDSRIRRRPEIAHNPLAQKGMLSRINPTRFG
jgi:hypothetical protein